MFPTLTDEQRRFISTVREWRRASFASAPSAIWTAIPRENMKPSPSSVFSAWRCPRNMAASVCRVRYRARPREIAKTCYVTAMAVLGEVGVQTRIISHYAPEAIKQRILPACAAASACWRSA